MRVHTKKCAAFSADVGSSMLCALAYTETTLIHSSTALTLTDILDKHAPLKNKDYD